MNILRMFKIFLIHFFFALILYFLFIYIKYNNFIWEKVFSYLQQALNLSALSAFSYSVGKIRQDNPIENFKKDRKSLIIFTLLYVWIFNLIIELSKDWFITKEIHVLNSIIYDLLWAVIATSLAVLFSGVFSKKRC